MDPTLSVVSPVYKAESVVSTGDQIFPLGLFKQGDIAINTIDEFMTDAGLEIRFIILFINTLLIIISDIRP